LAGSCGALTAIPGTANSRTAVNNVLRIRSLPEVRSHRPAGSNDTGMSDILEGTTLPSDVPTGDGSGFV